MILTIDIGNTNIGFRVFDDENIIYSFNLASDTKRVVDEYAMFVLGLLHNKNLKSKITKIAISSVVSNLDNVFLNLSRTYFNIEPFFINHKIKLPFEIAIKTPSEMGADRISNAAGGIKYYKAPFIIIDLGTATTFDVVNSKKEFLGGLIAPGIELQAKSLSKNTSKLPKIKIEEPQSAIGKTTIQAMLSGIVMGHNKMIEMMIKETEKELNEHAYIIGTGGLSYISSKNFDEIDLDLTHKGIKYLLELNT